MRKNSLLTLVLLLFSVPLPAREVPPGYREVARQENVPAEALYSLALTESSWTLPAHHPQAGEIHPWPWTLNVAGKGYRYPTRQAAWQAFDPYTNLHVAARILRRCYEASPGSWIRAAGCYHHPAGGQPAVRYKNSVRRQLATLTGGTQPVPAHLPAVSTDRTVSFVWIEPENKTDAK